MVKTTRFRRVVRGFARGGAATPLVSILEGQLAETIAACRVARAVAAGTTAPGAAHDEMAEIEQRGDTLRNDLVVKLAGAQAAPLDREDLFRLSRSIDEVLDNLRDFVREWDLYGIAPTDTYLGLLDATGMGVVDLRSAVHTLDRDAKDTGQAALVCKKSANEIRRLYDEQLGELFRGELTMEVLKVRELLRRLDVVGLRLNEAADVLSDAAVKRRA